MRKELQQRDPQSVTASNLLAKSYDVLGDFELQTGQTEDAPSIMSGPPSCWTPFIAWIRRTR